MIDQNVDVLAQTVEAMPHVDELGDVQSRERIIRGDDDPEVPDAFCMDTYGDIYYATHDPDKKPCGTVGCLGAVAVGLWGWSPDETKHPSYTEAVAHALDIPRWLARILCEPELNQLDLSVQWFDITPQQAARATRNLKHVDIKSDLPYCARGRQALHVLWGFLKEEEGGDDE